MLTLLKSDVYTLCKSLLNAIQAGIIKQCVKVLCKFKIYTQARILILLLGFRQNVRSKYNVYQYE